MNVCHAVISNMKKNKIENGIQWYFIWTGDDQHWFQGAKFSEKSKCMKEWNMLISKARHKTETVGSTRSMRDVCIITRIHHTEWAREKRIGNQVGVIHQRARPINVLVLFCITHPPVSLVIQTILCRWADDHFH